jgi:glycine/D-amino acid oxidase-like deaminating enzyme
MSDRAGEVSEVVVVGGGLIGCATAHALTGRGVRDVLVLERATVASGGTGKSSGVVRCHYGVPSLAAMAWEGLRFFENAAELVGDDVGFRRTGYLVGVGEANAAALRANLAAQAALGVETGPIGHDRAAELWPAADLEDFAAFGYEPRGGYGDAYRTARAFAAAARRGGATVRQGARVTELLTRGGAISGVRLADGSVVAAGTVVLAAGPWSAALAGPLGIDLPISAIREQILLVAPGTPLGAVPVFSDLVSLQYVRPEGSGELLFGNSDLSRPEAADPDAYRDGADTGFVERAVRKLAHRFPGLPEASIRTGYAGCYDVTPDFNPIIGCTPVRGLLVAAGFSGHGFKISPAVGTLLADLVCDGTSSNPRIPESDFRPSRFAEGEPLTSRHAYAGAGELR